MEPDWTQIGMFWCSTFLVLITIITSIINYRIFRNQTDPEVIVYSEPDVSRPTIINLVIENIGKGVAKDISFDSDRSIPKSAFGLNNQCKTPGSMNSGPFIVGIPELGPQSKRTITWGQYHGLVKGLGSGTITITVRYQSKKVALIRNGKFTSAFTLDILSYEGTDASDQNFEKKIAENIKEISNHLKKITTKIC